MSLPSLFPSSWVLGIGLGALLSLSASCTPSGDVSCADGMLCAPGQRCQVTINADENGDGEVRGVCRPVCASAQSCDVDAPVCDRAESMCRPCYPGEDALCLARSSSTPKCGPTGRCVQCVAVAQSGGVAEVKECQGKDALSTAPVCDAKTAACRACQLHSECASGVCAKDDSGRAWGVGRGSCVPVAQVLTVDQSLCSRSGPVFCTLRQAVERLDATHRYVLLRRAASTTDFTDLQIGGQPGQQDLPIHVIGPLADQSPAQAKTLPLVQLGGAMGKDALTITSAKVTVEGVYIKGGRAGLVCLGSGAQLRVVRSFITGADTGVYAASGCQLTVEQSWFGRGPAQGVYSETVGNKRSIEIASADFAISGSVFADNGDFRTDSFGGLRVRSLTAGKTTRSSLINNTFFQQSGLLKTGKYYTGVLCDSVAGDRLAIVNTLFLTEMPLLTTPYQEHYIDPSCGAVLSHLASNDPTLTDDGSLVLPMDTAVLRDGPGRDLRLSSSIPQSGTTVRNGGTPVFKVGADTLSAPAVDQDGKPRVLTGAGVSIGAYEP